MKYCLTLITLLSVLVASAASPRMWTLNDGRFFEATFAEMDKSTVVLTATSGKKARFDAENLGIADRFYLHTEHEVAIEDLQGGNIYTAEQDVKIKATSFEQVTGINIKGDGYDVSFEGILTPHYLVLHEKGAKPQLFAEELERVYFSHMYRHPDHYELTQGKRECYLFMKDEKLYEELGTALVAQLRAEGVVPNKHINQLEVNWSQYPGHNPWHLPKEYMEKYNAVERVDIEFAAKKQSDRKDQIIGFYNTRWYWYWPHRKHVHARVPGGSERHIADDRLNSSAYCYLYALNSSNDIRAHDDHYAAAGGGFEQSNMHAMGRYGATKKWAAELAKKVKDGSLEVNPVFETFYTAPSNDGNVTTPEKYRDFGLLTTGVGRFMEHDLEHMFGTCRFVNYMYKNKKVPTVDEMPEIYGYDSVEDLDAAFQEFLIKDNARMKP